MREYAQMNRYMFFGVMVLVGLGLGLYYGWVVSPVQFVDTTLDTLRVDYQTDIVLMVAEEFAEDKDTLRAVERLYLVGSESPLERVQAAMIFAVEVGYSPEDLALLRDLANAVRSWDDAIGSSISQ